MGGGARRSRVREARILPRAKARALLLASLGCALLIWAAVAWASQTLTFSAQLTPDRLGASTNFSAQTTVISEDGPPSPLKSVVAYMPAGLEVHMRGIDTCEKIKLETEGPSGCPTDSRIGFGGGIGVVQFGKEFVKEPYTLDFFLAPTEHGHLVVLIYANAVSPVPVRLIVVGNEVSAPKPYGFGISVEVPPIYSLPGAANASMESNYVSIGSPNVAYYETVHGKRTLVHVKGLTAPKTCSGEGFPFAITLSFADGTTSTAGYTYPCPRN
jgi:hypothetical protein